MTLVDEPRSAPGARDDWAGLAESTVPHYERMDEETRSRLRPTLLDDMTSEYDARFFSDYVRSLDIDFTPAFWRAEHQWAVDEAKHFTAVRSVSERLFGPTDAMLESRQPDFGPIAHLFTEELAILCLGAYDELVTVRGYQANLAMYDQLGPGYARFVRRVIADEASHYAAFLDVILRAHSHRFDDALDWVDRIRATDGVAYSATFVLDHDDPVYTEDLFDEATRVLRRQLERARRAKAPAPFGRTG